MGVERKLGDDRLPLRHRPLPPAAEKFMHVYRKDTSCPCPAAQRNRWVGWAAREASSVRAARRTATAGANAAQLLPQASYGYDAAGHVSSIVYPSGRKLSITYAGGVPTAIALAPNATAAATALVSQIQWQPFGPAKSWQWQLASGPQAHERVFDTSGRLVRYRLGNTIRDLTYDAADRISAYTHYDAATAAPQPTLDQGFGYDELGRLTQTTLYAGALSFSYDANGNRTAASIDGNARTYAVSATSNRIDAISNPARSFSYDATGNTTADGQFSAGYDLTGRMKTLTKAGITATYTYDNDGRRVRKFDSTGAASTVVFFHDLDGHLLGEYDQTGKAIREYVWLGDTLIAVFTPDPVNAANPPLVFYVHSDHLNTPRVIVDKNNAIRWRWFAEPFGTTAAESNPSGLGNFTFNLRFPGQYFDQESGLHYNRWRYYNAGDGRYTTSDPVGLVGGVNTYAYVSSNPLLYFDPNGLWAWGDPLPQGLVDFSAGMGDVLLFGQGQMLRDVFDVDGGINKCSSEYSAGEWTGIGISFATGVVGGVRAAGARAVGREFSHWIPARMGGPRTIFNGNYVSTATHALSDPYRYRFMPRIWKAANPMPSRISQQWTRIPNIYKGAAAGGAYGAAGAAQSDCTCPQ
jgi:RHS repeat-associated protein